MKNKYPLIKSKNMQIKELSILIFFILLAIFVRTRPAFSSSYQDVADVLAQNPAGNGCYTWTQERKLDCGKAIKVWRRCQASSSSTAVTEQYLGLENMWQFTYEQEFHPLICDGSCLGSTSSAITAKAWCAFNTQLKGYNCAGQLTFTIIESMGSCYPLNQSSPCLICRSASVDCTQYDTLIADFPVVVRETDLCGVDAWAKNPCGGDLTCGSGVVGESDTDNGSFCQSSPDDNPVLAGDQ